MGTLRSGASPHWAAPGWLAVCHPVRVPAASRRVRPRRRWPAAGARGRHAAAARPKGPGRGAAPASIGGAAALPLKARTGTLTSGFCPCGGASHAVLLLALVGSRCTHALPESSRPVALAHPSNLEEALCLVARAG